MSDVVLGRGPRSATLAPLRSGDRHDNGALPVRLGPARASPTKVAILMMALVLAGCSTTKPKPPPEPAPATVSLQEYMQQAAKANSEGARDKARETYRSAAKAYPASKEPWLKLAEDYFEATDYGNAILAGEEVLLRDASDNVAASVLAVSGLRVSSSALQSLRLQNRIAGDARSEAQTMAQTLRDVLGEAVLVPRPQATSASAPAATPTVAPKPRARVPVVSTPKAIAPVAAASAPATGSPFDKLK